MMDDAKSHWVGTWSAAPQAMEDPRARSLSRAVLRQVAHVTLGGRRLRVRFSNELGDGPLTIRAAQVALCRARPVDGSIDAETGAALAFAGAACVTVPPGRAVWSDPLDFPVAPLANLSVTTAFGQVPSQLTGHACARTTSYQQPDGDDVAVADLSRALPLDQWYALSGVDVMADAAAAAAVVLGDSLTDGIGATVNGHDNWPDQLAARLQADAATAKIAVLNQGIGGNMVVSGGLGPPLRERFDRDALAPSGVRWLILCEGINDLGAGVTAASLTGALDGLVARAHAQGLAVFGATITPFGGHAYYSPSHERERQQVNEHLRSSGKLDAVIDWDAAVTDGGQPARLRPGYDSGDGLHLGSAGYRAMAEAVDPALFR